MARPPILSLSGVSLTFGGDPLFSDISVAIEQTERLCLVGRNGSGKSTLLKIAAGIVQHDHGERFVQPGGKIAYLPQDPDLSGFETVLDYAAADVDEDEIYKAQIALDGLRLDGSVSAASASGGEKRRAALARMMASEPDLMLLDEPTNHLDVTAIEWLEQELLDSRTGYVVISHDRAFLNRVTKGTLWLDRGVMRRSPEGFGKFEAWQEKTFEEEDAEQHKLGRKIKREEHWIIHGVSGRRKRNVRRVAELADLREAKRTHIKRAGAAAMVLESGKSSGKLVIEAQEIAKTFGERTLLTDFSTKIMRGDRVAFVGPNGVGKTTLLKMLMNDLEPDTGSIRHGANIEVAVLDQTRDVPEHLSLWEAMTEDKLLGVKGSNDQIMVRGKPKHVVGYLKEFLFDESQARGPVSALSGGERARLLLAKIMARESNLLVLDEPTNDLDLETLDLLQELLAEYDGTLLLVSHDRDFIDRIATSTIAMEGDGQAIEYAGGWSDYRALRGEVADHREVRKTTDTKGAPPAPVEKPKPSTAKMSFKQTHRLEKLPAEIAMLEAEIAKLEELLADPELFSKDNAKFIKAGKALSARQEILAKSEEEWMELEALREEMGG